MQIEMEAERQSQPKTDPRQPVTNCCVPTLTLPSARGLLSSESSPAQADAGTPGSVESPTPWLPHVNTPLWNWLCFENKMLPTFLKLNDLEQEGNDC